MNRLISLVATALLVVACAVADTDADPNGHAGTDQRPRRHRLAARRQPSRYRQRRSAPDRLRANRRRRLRRWEAR